MSLYFASVNNNVRVRNLNLPWCLGGGGDVEVLVWIALISAASAFPQFFFFFSSFQPQWLTRSFVNSALVHCSWSHKLHFLSTFSLKMGLTVLFTHLKIILLQCFQFSVFSFSKISSIQTDPESISWNFTRDHMQSFRNFEFLFLKNYKALTVHQIFLARNCLKLLF